MMTENIVTCIHEKIILIESIYSLKDLVFIFLNIYSIFLKHWFYYILPQSIFHVSKEKNKKLFSTFPWKCTSMDKKKNLQIIIFMRDKAWDSWEKKLSFSYFLLAFISQEINIECKYTKNILATFSEVLYSHLT